MEKSYTDNMQHVTDEFILADLMLYKELLSAVKIEGVFPCKEMPHIKQNNEHLVNIFQDSKTVKALLSDNYSESIIEDVETLITELRQYIDTKIEKTIDEGKTLKLHELVVTYKLDKIEIQILLLLAAYMEDPVYEKLLDILQHKRSKFYTWSLVKILLGTTEEKKKKLHTYLYKNGTLFNSDILRLVESDGKKPLMTKQLMLHERVYSYITDSNDIDYSISNFCTLYNSDSYNSSIPVKEPLKNQLTSFITDNEYVIPIHLYSTKEIQYELPAAVCNAMNKSFLTADCQKAHDTGIDIKTMLTTLKIESNLNNAAVCLYNAEYFIKELEGEKRQTVIRNMIRDLCDFEQQVFIVSKDKTDFYDHELNDRILSIYVPEPDQHHRREQWDKHLKEIWPDMDSNTLAGSYRLSSHQIERAASQAKAKAALFSDKRETFNINYLYESCSDQTNNNLSKLAKKATTKTQWDDLVLPEGEKQHLHDIVAAYRNKNKVFNDWNFGQKRAYGNGTNALLYGPSGTGKTMAAGIIANELGLELYVIDLSTVVSKYIGETEKNLERIFTEAETSNAVLFFDEADALFGKRSDVKDAHDRYANIEVGYLLQRIEAFNGIVIMATNLEKNIDTAFRRRIQYKIKFSKPEAEERVKIWERTFPKEAPLYEDVDCKKLGENLQLTGAQIKNSALNAAYAAAETDSAITTELIVLACRREILKDQEIINYSVKNFGIYADIVKDMEGAY